MDYSSELTVRRHICTAYAIQLGGEGFGRFSIIAGHEPFAAGKWKS
jgi:hypothetical protein